MIYKHSYIRITLTVTLVHVYHVENRYQQFVVFSMEFGFHIHEVSDPIFTTLIISMILHIPHGIKYTHQID